MDFSDIKYEVRDGVAWVRIERSVRGNSFGSRTYAEVRSAVRLAELDDQVQVVVFTGSGKFFATGGDLDEVVGLLESGDRLAIFDFLDATPFDAIQNSEKVSIAAVNGICMAGGLMLTLSSDITIAAESARFSIPEGRVGLADPWIPSLLNGRGNRSLINYYMLTGKQFDAHAAREIGLVGEVVTDEVLLERAAEIADEVRQTTEGARRRYKRQLNAQRVPVSSEWLARMVHEPDVREGLRNGWVARRK